MKGIRSLSSAAKALCFCCALFTYTADANPIYSGNSCIWSIPTQQIPVPDSHCITEATLTICNVSYFDYDSSRLSVYAMSDKIQGFYGIPKTDPSEDVFRDCGLLLAEFEPNDITNNNLQICLGRIFNAASIAPRFNTPLQLQLSDGKWITLSPAIQQFMDILGSNSFFAFGFDSKGISFTSLSITVICKAYAGPASSTAFQVTSGYLYPPAIDSLPEMSVMENQEITFTLQGRDADDTSLIYYGLNLPAGSVLSENRFTWTPSWTQAGVYCPTFIVSDNKNSSCITMSIKVLDVNRPPVFQSFTNLTGQERILLTFPFVGEDPDGDPITFFALNLPAGAAIQSNRFSWLPSTGQAGRYEIVFMVSDGSLQNYQTAIIDISPASNLLDSYFIY